VNDRASEVHVAREQPAGDHEERGEPGSISIHPGGAIGAGDAAALRPRKPYAVKRLLAVLGPGFITGASDDDPSGIGTYATAGAALGFATLWTSIVTFPLMVGIQVICARIGVTSGAGLAGVLRRCYPRVVLYPALLGLVFANTLNAGADIGAIAAGINLIVPIPITALIIPIALGGDVSTWLTRGITVVVAGAPCALVMSTPVAMAAGIGSGGRRGVLIKGGMHLENLGRIRVLAVDKTGTLTYGRPAVTDIVPLDGGAPERVLGVAGAVERLSEHPLARAIVAAAEERRAPALEVADFEALTGAGARAALDGRVAYVGSPDLFAGLGSAVPAQAIEAADGLRTEGKTVVLVGEQPTDAPAPPRVTGLIAIRDQVRPNARAAIEALHRLGVRRIVMLSGDHPHTAQAIAAELGIDDVRAGLRPEDKVTAVRELEREHGEVAMVGDGVNDAPALAQATVGIAMGTAGTDAAIEAADVALMADDLEQAAFALRLGRKARRVSRQNVVFSLALLAVLIPGAAVGAFTIAIAVTVHEVAELLAVANGLRVWRA